MDPKTNEIPVARELFKKLDLDGRPVSLDARHTQDQTARERPLEHGADHPLTVKDNQPTLRATIENSSPPRRWIFPPRAATATLAGCREFNQGQPEVRVLRDCAGSAEAMDFPGVQQVTRLRRHLVPTCPGNRRAGDEPATGRAERGPVAGVQPRLNVSHRDDQGRVRWPRSLRVIGMFLRFSNSLFRHGHGRHKKPRHKTTIDFFTAMNAEHHCYALRCLQARHPSFLCAS